MTYHIISYNHGQKRHEEIRKRCVGFAQHQAGQQALQNISIDVQHDRDVQAPRTNVQRVDQRAWQQRSTPVT